MTQFIELTRTYPKLCHGIILQPFAKTLQLYGIILQPFAKTLQLLGIVLRQNADVIHEY